MPVLIDLTLSS